MIKRFLDAGAQNFYRRNCQLHFVSPQCTYPHSQPPGCHQLLDGAQAERELEVEPHRADQVTSDQVAHKAASVTAADRH
ncbi:MAG: hypothetical protein JO127_11185 [Caulobacteraceae bacterium]|nr:hypothetical protein [Caulobacteraceae bacterium]